MNNSAVQRALDKEREFWENFKIDDLLDEVAGIYPRVMHGVRSKPEFG